MMKNMKYHWTFVFILIYTYLTLLHTPSIWVSIILGLILIRIGCLGRKVWGISVLLLVLFTVRFHISTHHQQTIKDLPLENQSDSLILKINPLEIKEGNYYAHGRGEVLLNNEGGSSKQTIPIIYRFSKDLDLIPDNNHDRYYYLQVKGTFTHPQEGRNFYVFDYRNYLSNQGIDWQLDVESSDGVLDYDEVSFTQKLKTLRLKWLNRLKKVETTTWGALYNKLLWNLDSDIYQDYKGDFAALGIVHLFAISGFHMYFIRRTLYYILIRSGIRIEPAQVLLEGCLFIYACLIAWPVGVSRSLGGTYLGKLTKRFKLPFSSLDILGVLGIIMLAVNPYWAWSLSFILSFLMTYLIKFYVPIAKKRAFSQKRQNFEISLLCLLFSWPILMQMNHQLSVWQLAFVLGISVVFEKCVMPMMMATTLLVVFPWAHGLFQFLSQGFEWLWQWGVGPLLDWHRPLITGRLGEGWWFCLIIAGILWLYYLTSSSTKAYGIVLCLYIITLNVLPYARLDQRVTILDVGQGDALLYQPVLSKEAWVIDTGGKVSWGKEETQDQDQERAAFAHRNIIPSLKALGVREITGLIITHPDADHMASMKALIQAVPVKRIYVTDYTLNSDLWQSFEFGLDIEKKVRTVPFGQKIQVGGSQMTFYTIDEKALTYSSDQSNDSSIVTTIKMGDYIFLNLGDLSAGGEEKLVKTYPHLRADLVKIAHHGSQTSTSQTLINHLQPSIAFISCGVDNRYGHPHKEVIDRLEADDIAYYQTSKQGAIRIQHYPWAGIKISTVLDK